jgi:hypothetical protein
MKKKDIQMKNVVPNSRTLPPASATNWLRYLQHALVVILILSGVSFAQIPPDRDGLLNAEGLGQAKYAEMNGYPGPKHVLDLADKLKLTAEQKKSVQVFYDEMSTRAKELGKQIVGIEKELNDAFAQGFVNQKSVGNDAEEIGRLRGRLRAVHLVAHMKTKAVLNESQIALYRKLRSAGEEAKH